jgi:hypothetical protein
MKVEDKATVEKLAIGMWLDYERDMARVREESEKRAKLAAEEDRAQLFQHFSKYLGNDLWNALECRLDLDDHSGLPHIIFTIGGPQQRDHTVLMFRPPTGGPSHWLLQWDRTERNHDGGYIGPDMTSAASVQENRQWFLTQLGAILTGEKMEGATDYE